MASSFDKAFAAARKAGKKEFTWNGKSYNTELKETARPMPRGGKKETGPRARPKEEMRPKSRPRSRSDMMGPKHRPSMGPVFPSESKNPAKLSAPKRTGSDYIGEFFKTLGPTASKAGIEADRREREKKRNARRGD